MWQKPSAPAVWPPFPDPALEEAEEDDSREAFPAAGAAEAAEAVGVAEAAGAAEAPFQAKRYLRAPNLQLSMQLKQSTQRL